MRKRLVVLAVGVAAMGLTFGAPGAQADEFIDIAGCASVGTSGYVGGVSRCMGTGYAKCVTYNALAPSATINGPGCK